MRRWSAHVRGFLLQPEVPLIWIGAVAILTFAEPFSLSPDATRYTTVFYWALLMALVVGFVAGLCGVATEFMQDRSRAFRIVFVSAGMAVLTVPTAIALDAIIFEVNLDTVELLVTVICAAVIMAALRLMRVSKRDRDCPGAQGDDAAAADDMPDGPALPTAPTRLSARLSRPDAQILAVSANDHYISVLTVDGPQSVLLRFSDALEELDDLPGLRIHRSHWVVREGVKGVRLTSQKAELELIDGTRLPISRTYRALVEAEGFPELRTG